MEAMTSNQALTLFGRWERENKVIALLFSTPSAAMSFKHGRIMPFLDTCLFLAFGEDNVLRIFLQEAKFWFLEQNDIPEESREATPKFEQCVRIVTDPTMQCFLCASGSPVH
jgi:hypothetical protein